MTRTKEIPKRVTRIRMIQGVIHGHWMDKRESNEQLRKIKSITKVRIRRRRQKGLVL